MDRATRLPNGFAVLPYIKGVTKPLIRILNNNGIRATTRPVRTLQQEFASPKSRPPSDRQTNVFYKIPCSDCTWNYIGETGRSLQNRKKEHIRNTKVFKKGSNIASHAWLKGHTIDFENARVIDRGNSREEKRWNLGTLQLIARQTIILSSCQNNTQFCYNVICILLSHKYFFCLCIFIYSLVIFSPFCIFIFTSALYTSLFKIADLQSKARVFKLLIRERLFNSLILRFVLWFPGFVRL